MRALRKILLISSLLAPFVGAKAAGWGRISYVRGDVFIIGVDDDRWGYATINTIVEEGDIIRTEDGSRVEIQLSTGTAVRMDERSEAEFTVMEDDGISIITVVYGILEASMPYWARSRDVHIAFTGGDAEMYRGSRVRVEVDDNGDSYVIVRRERVRLHLPDETRILNTHRIAYIDPSGQLQWIDRYYDRDSFDRWCDMRDRDVLRRPRLAYGDVQLGLHIYIGLSELDMYGHWRRVPGYGLVWVPDVDAYWRPYSNGHWVWTVRWGWVWVPYEPWGWVPFHYGRWAFVSGVGWIWVPGYDFAPAWVVWTYGPDWVAWAPLDPWGNPIIVINHIAIINIVDRRSFCDPVYRYRPPVRGRYEKPYRTVSVKVSPNQIQKSYRWTQKPPIDYAKPAPPPADVKQKLVSARVRAIEVVQKSPVVKVKPQIVQSKIEHELKLNPELKKKVSIEGTRIGPRTETPVSTLPRTKTTPSIRSDRIDKTDRSRIATPSTPRTETPVSTSPRTKTTPSIRSDRIDRSSTPVIKRSTGSPASTSRRIIYRRSTSDDSKKSVRKSTSETSSKTKRIEKTTDKKDRVTRRSTIKESKKIERKKPVEEER